MTMLALAAAQLLSAATTPVPPPHVFLRAPDDLVRGAIALALVDEGIAVATAPAAATLEVTIARDGDAYVVTCVGDGGAARGANVAAGAPALVELELQHRVAALAWSTPPRGAAPAPPGVVPQLVDKAGRRFNDAVAAALLDAGVSLAPADAAAARLCVDAGVDVVTVAWGSTAERCDGRPVGVARADLVARVLVGEALRLQDAAPVAAPTRVVVDGPLEPPSPSSSSSSSSVARSTAPPATARAATSTPTPTAAAPAAPATTAATAATATTAATAATATAPMAAPAEPAEPAATTATATARGVASQAEVAGPAVALSVRAGALGRLAAESTGDPAADPWVEASALVPLARVAGVDVGVAAVAGGTGTTDPLLIGEALAGAGAGASWPVASWLALRAAVIGGAWVQGWRFDASDAGVTVDPLVAVPASVELRLTSFLTASVAATAGASRRDRIHTLEGDVAWSRSAVFLSISGGLTFDLGGGGS